MAGTIIADKIQTENSFLTLNVGQTQIATMNASGVFSNTGIKMIGTDGTVTAILSSPSISSNLTFTGTGNRILGDFSNGTLANRVLFQTSTTNDATSIGVIPNGTNTFTNIAIFNNSDTANSGIGTFTATSTQVFLEATKIGTGTYLPLTMFTGGSERLRIDTSGNVGIGTTTPSSFGNLAVVSPSGATTLAIRNFGGAAQTAAIKFSQTGSGGDVRIQSNVSNDDLQFLTAATERMRIDSSGFLLIGTTNTNPAENNVKGASFNQDGRTFISAMGTEVMRVNRGTDDGTLIWFHQAGTAEGSISVSGTTVSYNGGHLARYSQLPTGARDVSIVKGTVMSNLDAMCEWLKDGEPTPNEQLNKMKVSDVEGDKNVAGVFVNWDNDDKDNTFDMNIAMTGDMIIRIAEGVTVARGDLLMSAGDGTAKPQDDDIVRSKTIAKVTSTHVTCTYEDGSYCVPCVLMAC